LNQPNQAGKLNPANIPLYNLDRDLFIARMRTETGIESETLGDYPSISATFAPGECASGLI
jgi:hypothetical protein